jgi:hypothetical protein
MQEIDIIYDRYGRPVFRVLDNGRFVTFSGKNMGFLKGDSLYNYVGRHVGWYSNGLVRDHQGNVVGFGQNVTDSIRPFLPFKQFKPFASFVEFESFRPFTQFEPFRPFKRFYWSDIDLDNLFN